MSQVLASGVGSFGRLGQDGDVVLGTEKGDSVSKGCPCRLVMCLVCVVA